MAAALALERVRTDAAVVASIWWFEVRNTLIVNERRGRITQADTAAFLRGLTRLGAMVDRTPEEAAVLALARTHRLTVHDSSYLELAQREALPLVTLDQPLRALLPWPPVPAWSARHDSARHPNQLPATLFSPAPRSAQRFVEFFTAHINNEHTRQAYLNATRLQSGESSQVRLDGMVEHAPPRDSPISRAAAWQQTRLVGRGASTAAAEGVSPPRSSSRRTPGRRC